MDPSHERVLQFLGANSLSPAFASSGRPSPPWDSRGSQGLLLLLTRQSPITEWRNPPPGYELISLKGDGLEKTAGISRFRLKPISPANVNIKQNKDKSYKVKSEVLRTIFSPTGFFTTAAFPEKTQDDHWTFPADKISVDWGHLRASWDDPRPTTLTDVGKRFLQPELERCTGTKLTGNLWVTCWESMQRLSSGLQPLEDGSKDYLDRDESVDFFYIHDQDQPQPSSDIESLANS